MVKHLVHRTVRRKACTIDLKNKLPNQKSDMETKIICFGIDASAATIDEKEKEPDSPLSSQDLEKALRDSPNAPQQSFRTSKQAAIQDMDNIIKVQAYVHILTIL